MTELTKEPIVALLEEITPNSTEKDCNEKFPKIAEELMNHYVIVKGEETYRILEVEFYYYNHSIDDFRDDSCKKQVTYLRTTKVGQWFFHNSGIDLTFNSNKEEGFGGGILLRKIKSKEGKVIDGSLKCYWELFDETADAFAPICENPHLEKAERGELQIVPCKRHNLKDNNNREWQFRVVE